MLSVCERDGVLGLTRGLVNGKAMPLTNTGSVAQRSASFSLIEEKANMPVPCINTDI